MKKNNEKGFSLVELLVVVIIIAIIAAIAIPNLLASRRAANEASAVSSLRTINSAQASYYALNNNVYGTLTTLSGAGLLDPTFTGASFLKSGYTIAESYNSGNNTYCASAATTTGNGTNSYAIDQNGVVYKYASLTGGSSACASGTLTVGSGSPL
jgi:prepilin-type N-terminal cleavage/methylation domain-containing protein